MHNSLARVQFDVTSCGNLREKFGTEARHCARNWTFPNQLSLRQTRIIIHHQALMEYATVPSDSVPRQFHINPLNAELNPIRHLLALVAAHHIVHVSSVRVKKKDRL